MRIGIDARLIHWPGIGRYIQSLLHYLPQVNTTHDYVAYFANDVDAHHLKTNAHTANLSWRTFSAPVFSISEQWHWPIIIRQDRLNLFHAPHYVSPLFSPVPVVVTIHDLVGFRFPQDLYSPAARLYYHWMTRLSVWRADQCITVSHFSRQELLTLLGASPDKVQVVHSGVERHIFHPQPGLVADVRHRYHLPEIMILYLGTRKPWKNLPMLLRAFQAISADHPDAWLILAGKAACHQEDIQETIQALGLSQRVRELGYVPEVDLPALYHAATVVVMPSYYEGFGLPVLEAMACGAPVIAGQAAALPEVVGDAGLLLPPHHVMAWADTLRQLLHDANWRDQLVQRGLSQVQQFDWRQTAAKTLAIYESVPTG